MKNTKNNKIVLALFVTVLALSAFAPVASAEVTYWENVGGMTNVIYEPEVRNPRPAIFSVNPNPIVAGSGGMTLTVVGDKFVSGAVVKVNNFDRSTSFVSKTRLNVELLASDFARVGDKVITVYNPGPGGGLSNSVVLSVVSPSTAAPKTTVSSGSISAGTSSSAKSTTTTKKTTTETEPEGEVLGDEDYGDLAGAAIVGSGGFFPGSLVGWLILAILILLLVIIIRRMLGAEKRYHETPLKHA